jgi:antitoxin VapB
MPSRPKSNHLPSPKPHSVRARVFRTGGSRAVRLPKEFRPEGDEVLMTRVEEGLLISPLPAVLTVADWWDGWQADPDFMADGRHQPAMQKRDFSH